MNESLLFLHKSAVPFDCSTQLKGDPLCVGVIFCRSVKWFDSLRVFLVWLRFCAFSTSILLSYHYLLSRSLVCIFLYSLLLLYFLQNCKTNYTPLQSAIFSSSLTINATREIVNISHVFSGWGEDQLFLLMMRRIHESDLVCFPWSERGCSCRFSTHNLDFEVKTRFDCVFFPECFLILF